jgi:ribosomal protein L3 glutamine methyltransferase
MAALPAEYRAEPALALDGRRRRRHGLRAPLLAGRPAHLARTACWCWRSATSASTSRPPFPRLAWVWLPTSAGDDQVLLI